MVALAACRSKSPTAPAADAAAWLAPSAVASADAVAPAAAGDAVVVGMDPRAGVAPDAQKANDAAFAAHEKKNFEASRDGFRHAVEIDPEFTLARFNLACALARTGALDDAERELSRVLREDLVAFRGSFERDPDLAPLRDSAPHATRLRALVASLTARYREVFARGLRSLLWAPSKASHWGTNQEQRAIAQASVLRAGFYDPDTKRFIATTPRPKKPLTALWGNETPYAVVLTGAWNPYCGGDLCQWIEGVSAEVFDDSLSGEPIGRIVTKGQEGVASAEWSGGELSLEVLQAFDDKNPGTFLHTWSPAGGVKTKKLPERRGPAKKPVTPFVTASLVHPLGNVGERVAAGVAYDAKSKTMTSATNVSVPLPDAPAKKGPLTIALAANGKRALAVWDVTPDCDPEHNRSELKLRRVAFLVDFDAKTAAKVADVKGALDVGFDARGEAYVQKDATIEHVTATGTSEALPAGLVFSPPTLNEWQCVGFW